MLCVLECVQENKAHPYAEGLVDHKGENSGAATPEHPAQGGQVELTFGQGRLVLGVELGGVLGRIVEAAREQGDADRCVGGQRGQGQSVQQHHRHSFGLRAC